MAVKSRMAKDLRWFKGVRDSDAGNNSHHKAEASTRVASPFLSGAHRFGVASEVFSEFGDGSMIRDC